MVTLSPIVRLDDKSTMNIWRAIPVKFLTVRLQDILKGSSADFNKTFYEILAAGGVHNYLEFNGPVVLSAIMRDYLISKLGIDGYVEAINVLKPDYYTTPDCETYEGFVKSSWREIDRILEMTKDIMSSCPYSEPIGQVKGCNEYQVDYHIQKLKEMGIDKFVFHVGDFFRNGDKTMINKARFLSSRIRPHTKSLILYGMGSQKKILEFSFADAYVTFGYFTTARYGMMYKGTKKIKYARDYNPSIAMLNLIEMYKNVASIKKQCKLIGDERKWVEVEEGAEPHMHPLMVKIRA